MANIKFSRKVFEKEIGKLDEQMQTKIAMFGTTLESFDDEEIEIEVFPNRPDLLSYQGFKRSFLAFIGKKTGLKTYRIDKPEKDYQIIIDNSVKNVRPFTACAIVKNLKFDDDKIKEMIDMQEKLHNTVGRRRKKVAIGIYPLEKIKLPITFKALEPDKIKFIPLESDREMSGLDILQKHSAGRDYAHLLAGKEKFPIFIDAENNILSMPPIINSQLTGKVTEQTKDIFIECSGFEMGILKKCLNILATCFADMGGKIYQMNLMYGRKIETTPDLSSETMKISVENANKLLGLDLNEKQLKKLFEKMGYDYKKPSTLLIPAWRTDILHEVDLMEDIAIAYGYENFEPEIPRISTTGEEDFREIIKRKISEILTGLGFLEISNYHLTNKNEQFKKMGVDERKSKEFIEVENSKTDYNILRKNLSHYLLKILSENVDAEYPHKIFEIGRVFDLDKNKEITEKENLALAVCPGNFTEAKQILEYLFRILDIDIRAKEPESENISEWFIDGRTAEVMLNKEKESEKNVKKSWRSRFGWENKNPEHEQRIGFIGEVHPKILKNWKLKMPVVIFEIGLGDVFGKLSEG